MERGARAIIPLVPSHRRVSSTKKGTTDPLNIEFPDIPNFILRPKHFGLPMGGGKTLVEIHSAAFEATPG